MSPSSSVSKEKHFDSVISRRNSGKRGNRMNTSTDSEDGANDEFDPKALRRGMGL